MRTGSDLLDKISYDAKGGVDHLSLSVHMGRENMKTTLGREKKASFAPTASSLAAFVSLVSSSRVDKGQRSETFGFSVPWPSPKLLGNKLIRSSHENHASYFDATQSSFFSFCFCASCSYSEHRFPVPSSKLCQNWLCHWRGALRGHAAVPWYCQCPLKGLVQDWKTVNNAVSKHTHKQCLCTPENSAVQKLSVVIIMRCVCLW